MNLIIETSKKDWDIFLLEVGFSKKDVEHYMKNKIDTPEFNTTAGEVVNIKNKIYYKAKSNIHGYGIFSKKDINKNSRDIIESTDRIFLKETIEKYVSHDMLNYINFKTFK